MNGDRGNKYWRLFTKVQGTCIDHVTAVDTESSFKKHFVFNRTCPIPSLLTDLEIAKRFPKNIS